MASALVAIAGLFLSVVARPAAAAPGDAGIGDEGENQTLAQVLEETGRAWVEAKQLLDASKARQAERTTKLQAAEAELARLTATVGPISAAAYRSGGLRTAAVLLASDSPDSFFRRATSINTIAAYNDRQLNRFNRLRKEQADGKAAIDAEVATQQRQFDVMAKKKLEAEKALALAGGRATGGFVSVSSPLAEPAPRRADGTWAPERCVLDDPTTTGCVTARTIHAYNESRADGFTRYTACYRDAQKYEHPKGRACDFSASVDGFGGVATGNDRLYGNNLAAYLVRNAERLGVMQVIWFKQIWTPPAGWHSYSGAGGDPASDHTNHVHLSVF